METYTRNQERRCDIPVQFFNGKEYHLYHGERYFSRGCKRMHVAVWEFYHGEVPKGYHIHHKDENTWNNSIENLELLNTHVHLSLHAQEYKEKDGAIEELRGRMDYARKYASEWHRSEQGRAWHREHARKNIETMQKKEYVCKNCGETYMAFPMGSNKFCSNKCKSAWRRQAHLDEETRVCQECGRDFVTNRFSKTRCCSRPCSQRFSYRKKTLREYL